MPKECPLRHACQVGKHDEALYWTCKFMHEDKLVVLEDAWIEMLAGIGAMQDMPHKAAFTYVANALLHVLESEQMHVRDVVTMTAMLLLLQKKASQKTGAGAHIATLVSSSSSTSFARLRKQVIDHFPEGAMLSYKGTEMFAQVLPAPQSETYPFCHRILAGLARLLAKPESFQDAHAALEYLSRRKIQIPLPSVWPAPTEDEAMKGDICWFLWGAAMLYMQSNEHVVTLWQLFCWNWRKGVKNSRLGLLWSTIHMHRVVDPTFTWSKEEIKVLERVNELAPDLWQQVREGDGEGDNDYDEDGSMAGNSGAGGMGEMDGLDAISSFLPRLSHQPSAPMYREEAVAPLPTRKVKVSGGSKRGTSKEDVHIQRDSSAATASTFSPSSRYDPYRFTGFV